MTTFSSRDAARAARLSHQLREVLLAIADQRVTRGVLFGNLEPFRLDGRTVDWQVRALVLRALASALPLGAPALTRRGHRTVLALIAEPVARGGAAGSPPRLRRC